VTLPELLAAGRASRCISGSRPSTACAARCFRGCVAAYQATVGANDTAKPGRGAVVAGQAHFAQLCRRLLDMDESAIEALSHEVGTIALP
jgi:hypothetical protein